MQYVNLGHSGLKVSRVAIGSWLTYGSSVGRDGAAACIQAALDAGVILIDTADIYNYGEAEDLLGDILDGVHRPDYVLATKAFWPMSDNPNNKGLSRKHLFESAEASLKRLRTDYIELYQCHRYDAETPVEETVRAMGDLIAQGKVLYWGVSCWRAAQIVDACHIADSLGVPRPISNQPPYNLMTRDIEQEVVPRSMDEGLSQIVFSPLAQGSLTGKYSGGVRPAGSRGAGRLMSVHIVIPARYASSRLPGKPLADIAGLPMVVRTAQQAAKAASDLQGHQVTQRARFLEFWQHLFALPSGRPWQEHVPGSRFCAPIRAWQRLH